MNNLRKRLDLAEAKADGRACPRCGFALPQAPCDESDEPDYSHATDEELAALSRIHEAIAIRALGGAAVEEPACGMTAAIEKWAGVFMPGVFDEATADELKAIHAARDAIAAVAKRLPSWWTTPKADGGPAGEQL